MARDLFKIPNLIEPFNDPKLGFNPDNPKFVDGQPADLYKWVGEQSAGVMKLLGINLHYVDVDKLLSVGKFDRVVIIERKNLTDCCVSLGFAELTSKYHYKEGESVDIKSFDCDSGFVDRWISMYKKYLVGVQQVKNNTVPCDVICYEDFMMDQVQYVADMPLQKSKMSDKLFGNKKMISLDLPYSILCTNYYEVEEKIRKELC